MSESLYRRHWDYYAEKAAKNDRGWPGDEWGTETSWQWIFDKMFLSHGASEWASCVEVGSGSGKYTLRVLQASPIVHVIAADVSSKFQGYCRKRLEQAGVENRVTFVALDMTPGTLLDAIRVAGLMRMLDAFFSIDAMVHVDLQHHIVYLVTAAFALRLGGKLILTLANSTSDSGFAKLVRDAPQMFRRQDGPTARFEWMSPEMVRDILQRLGFEIDWMDTRGRDILLVASKREEPAEELRQVLQ
jgi:SAM-dependent methyltransferase